MRPAASKTEACPSRIGGAVPLPQKRRNDEWRNGGDLQTLESGALKLSIIWVIFWRCQLLGIPF